MDSRFVYYFVFFFVFFCAHLLYIFIPFHTGLGFISLSVCCVRAVFILLFLFSIHCSFVCRRRCYSTESHTIEILKWITYPKHKWLECCSNTCKCKYKWTMFIWRLQSSEIFTDTITNRLYFQCAKCELCFALCIDNDAHKIAMRIGARAL